MGVLSWTCGEMWKLESCKVMNSDERMPNKQMLTLKKLRMVFGPNVQGKDGVHSLDWTMP